MLVNSDAFEERNLKKVGYEISPLEDGSLAAYRVIQVPMTAITQEACKPLGVKPRDAERSKNFFALGLITWMYTRPVDPTVEWIEQRFSSRPQVRDANLAAFKAGLHFAETAELFEHAYEIQPARLEPGQYRNITGNIATAYGLIAGAQQAKLPILYASYPITPASDILHELSKHKNFGVRTLQAEDEIAAAAAAIGGGVRRASRHHRHERPGRRPQVGGHRPGDQPRAAAGDRRRAARRTVDRAAHQDRAVRPDARDVRPPRRVAAADRRRVQSPSHCFEAAFEAVRLALKYRTPVILLTDGYVANGSEPWRLPDIDALPDISVPFADGAEPRRRLLAVPARPRDPGPSVGDSRHAGARSTASAASRSRTAPATSTTSPTTTSS